MTIISEFLHPIYDLTKNLDTLFMTSPLNCRKMAIYDQKGRKTYPLGAAHTYLARIREPPPPRELQLRQGRCLNSSVIHESAKVTVFDFVL